MTRASFKFTVCKILILLTVFFFTIQPDSGFAAEKKKKRPAAKVTSIEKSNPKYASIVIDADTGTILHQDQPDAIRHPASLTKMMSLLLVFEALDSGRIKMDTRIPISKRAASMPPSKLGLPVGASIRVADAIGILATASANDISVALAEALAGSESAFAQKMTAKAASLGMTRTKFYNASGLPNQYQVSTARDMARLGRYLIQKHPTRSKIFSKQNYVYNGRTFRNHNRLMETYAGMDCCKTGFINASGFNLVASARRDGRRLIGVVFGGRTTVTRNVHMAKLLDEGFKKAGTTQIAKATQPEPTAQNVKPTVLASTSPESGIIQEAYEKAQEPIQEVSAFEVKRIPPAKNASASLQPQSLGTVQLSSLNARESVNPYAKISAPVPSPTSAPAQAAVQEGWAIQIGAYQTRMATDQAISQAKQRLPAHLKKSQSLVVPLRTAEASWMFRARLAGFSQMEAREACQYFKECLTISPQAY